MRVWALAAAAFIGVGAMSAEAQSGGLDSGHLPRFEEFPARNEWKPPAAALQLTERSERMFKTRLKEAANAPPNFAGHYRMTVWGCGSGCSAGALVDLKTGQVIPLPLAKADGRGWDRWIHCAACFDGAGNEFHVNSRLMIVRCGLNYSERLRKNVPDTYYFVLEEGRFRRLLLVSGKQGDSEGQ